MRILLMRHAHASSKMDADVALDLERPLSPTGERHAQHVAQHLRQLGQIPAIAFTSPAVRTQTTAACIQETMAEDFMILPLALLVPGSGTDELLQVVANYHDSPNLWALVVMHQPDIGYILGNLLLQGRAFPFDIQPGDLFALDINAQHDSTMASLLFSFSPVRWELSERTTQQA